MMRLSYIICAASVAISSLDGAAYAKPLTPQERVTCADLRVCVDIIRRHDASEFDYSVLERDFKRFGAQGRAALFEILKSDEGNADIARMILSLGSLQPAERRRVYQDWTPETSARFLPLFMDGDIRSAHKVLLTLAHADANVREHARKALLRFPENALVPKLSKGEREVVLRALINDPMSEVALFVEAWNVEGQAELFGLLLRSGNPELVSASYAALYRADPKQAFDLLLSEMRKIESASQARAIGEMLARRHVKREDGFYLKFAHNVSGDTAFPVPARAAGLHAVLRIPAAKVPSIQKIRKPSLVFLVQGQADTALDIYLPTFEAAKDTEALRLIWHIAKVEKWVSLNQVATFYEGVAFESDIVRDLILSDDLRSVKAGLSRANKSHESAIKSQINHPVKEIANAARRAMNLPKLSQNARENCFLARFDPKDKLAQMPFFDSAWLHTGSGGRVAADRRALVTAYPTAQGWLAGYDLDVISSSRSHSGGELVQFENKTGGFRRVGNFNDPIAILPNRSLRLGETTSRFWIIDGSKGDDPSMSAYQLDLTATGSPIRRVGNLPRQAKDFSVAPNGDLLVTSRQPKDDIKQPPLRYKSDGRVSLACVLPAPSAAPPALN